MAFSSSFLGKIFDLGFYTELLEKPPFDVMSTGTMMYSYSELATMKPKKQKTSRDLAWEVGCWLLLALASFLLEATSLSNGLAFDIARVSPQVFLASTILALALFGPFMRWLNKQRTGRGLLKIALPLGFGFLAAIAAEGILYAGKLFLS